MKKNVKFIPVNNQEDEDGYNSYPENAMIEGDRGKKQDLRRDQGYPEPDSSKPQSGNKHDLILSSSVSGQTRSGSSIIRRG